MTMPRWSLSLKTAPTSEPISLEEAKAQLRVSLDSADDDELIEALIIAAREQAETFTGRALLSQTWYLKLDTFPDDGSPILVPRPPLQSVTAITYVDMNGATQTWAASLYQVSAPAGPKAQNGRILPAYGQYYPLTRDQMDAVSIEFLCGWTEATEALKVPTAIKLGMKVALTSWFMRRGDDSLVELVKSVPETAELLWWPYVVTPW